MSTFDQGRALVIGVGDDPQIEDGIHFDSLQEH
jgi:hypothetical protein